ncbi:MAG: putative glutamine amidotransferase, class-II [Verrucomicrobiaceae bacterium]|nr:putative glutamine amidotransferase, class-II [Verrucomicrobiaceae bacterium]
MCELFGVSSREPTTVQISLAEFAKRGGLTGPHIDGWGIAFFGDGDVQLIREPKPSADSAHLRFIHDQHIPSALVISHIRRATQGSVCLRNTQPFIRELGGRPHTFAHNGDLVDIHRHIDLINSPYRAIGDTDSEYAFCYLLSLLQPLWNGNQSPSLAQRFEAFNRFAQHMTEFGAANFLYSDGEFLFVHSHYRRYDDNTVCQHGLFMLNRRNHEHEILAGIDVDSDQEMVLLASAPLSGEEWESLPEHTALAIQDGRVVLRSCSALPA